MVHDDAVRRLRRPTWRDPRLGVGVLLVAGSVALGTWAVRDAADTVEVYATREAVTPGQSLDASALVVQEVRLGAQESLYLRADADLPEGAVAVRTVGAGELVPRSALGLSDDVDARPVVVPLDARFCRPCGTAPNGSRFCRTHASCLRVDGSPWISDDDV